MGQHHATRVYLLITEKSRVLCDMCKNMPEKVIDLTKSMYLLV